jgi:cytochrome c biogenesis protein CcmG, thiol:disulfide interchange protein DsbE
MTTPTRAALAAAAAVLLAAGLVAAVALSRSWGGDAGQHAAPPQTAQGPSATIAPEVAFELFDGTSARLADYRGSLLLVNFWASWCPPCVAEMPDLETVHRELRDEVAFLGINTQDDGDAAAELAERTGVTYDLALDPAGDLFRAFGVFGMPSTFLVSADGEIVDRHTGILTEAEIRSFLEGGVER